MALVAMEVGRCLILFHPDCNRRLWHLTKSADPPPRRKEALAGSPEKPGYRRWGISPRPENKCNHTKGILVELSRDIFRNKSAAGVCMTCPAAWFDYGS